MDYWYWAGLAFDPEKPRQIGSKLDEIHQQIVEGCISRTRQVEQRRVGSHLSCVGAWRDDLGQIRTTVLISTHGQRVGFGVSAESERDAKKNIELAKRLLLEFGIKQCPPSAWMLCVAPRPIRL